MDIILSKKAVILAFFIFGLTVISYGQAGKNYPQFDRRKFHFGFALGANTANFRYTFQPGIYGMDTIINVNVKRVPGFNLGIVSSFDLHEMVHFRFVPSLSFQEREFQYGFLEQNGVLKTKTTRLESTFLDFPVMLKLRTKRINNFAAFGLMGIQYSLDLATQSDAAPDPLDPFMKMQQHDFATQFGGGFDFFMAYYKFAIELKISNGFKNLHIQDESFFTYPLTSLKSKVWWFSITFEG